MLEEKGEVPRPKPECTITLDISAFIPASYVGSTAQRIALYKRVAMIASEEDLRDIADELCDRFEEPAPSEFPALGAAASKALSATSQKWWGDNIKSIRTVDAMTWFELTKVPSRCGCAAGEHVLVGVERGGNIIEFLSRMFDAIKNKSETVDKRGAV